MAPLRALSILAILCGGAAANEHAVVPAELVPELSALSAGFAGVPRAMGALGELDEKKLAEAVLVRVRELARWNGLSGMLDFDKRLPGRISISFSGGDGPRIARDAEHDPTGVDIVLDPDAARRAAKGDGAPGEERLAWLLVPEVVAQLERARLMEKPRFRRQRPLPDGAAVEPLDRAVKLYRLYAFKLLLASERFAAESKWALLQPEIEAAERLIREGGSLTAPRVARVAEPREPDEELAQDVHRAALEDEKAVRFLLERKLVARDGKRLEAHERLMKARAGADALDGDVVLEELREAERLAREAESDATTAAAKAIRAKFLFNVAALMSDGPRARTVIPSLARMGPEAQGLLAKAVLVNSSSVRESAVSTLTEMPVLPADIAKELRAAAYSESFSREARLAAARVLVKTAPEPGLLSMLAKALSAGTKEQIIFETALLALQDLGAAAAPAWREALRDGDSFARRHAVKGLVASARSNPSDAAAIARAVYDPVTEVSDAAQEALEQLKSRK